jgi:hypothetical protein
LQIDDGAFNIWMNGRTAKTWVQCQQWLKNIKVLIKAVKHITLEDGYGCLKCYHARYEKHKVEHGINCLEDGENPTEKVKMQRVFQSNLRGFCIVEEVELPDNIDDETERILLVFRQEADEFAKSGIPEVGCFPKYCINV